MTLAIINARVLTMRGPGQACRELGVLDEAFVFIQNDEVVSVSGTAGTAPRPSQVHPDRIIDARGRILMPAFVDCHTHACWAGDRLDEWDLRRAGASYLDILESGGGIMSTVRAVRAASESELASTLLARLNTMLREGTTTVEVKSGYGLTPEDELKMLRAIRTAAAKFAGTVVPTALLGHAFDPDEAAIRGQDGYVDWIIAEALPAVTRDFGRDITIDAYCEKGAWSLEHCTRLFEAARVAGHPFRVHADQFNRLGMVQRAVAMGATSIDHLEASGDDELDAIGRAPNTFAVMLPICGLHLDGRFASGRKFLDRSPNAKLAIATNFNPGSAPCGSMPTTIAAAVRNCGLTPAEAIAAATTAPAKLLGFSDRGTIAPGTRADLILLRHTDERMLAYEFGCSPIDMVISGGRVVYQISE